MSERPLDRILEGRDAAEVERRWREAAADPALAEQVLEALALEERRHTLLGALRAASETGPLLAAFTAALRSPRDAQRRNAARSALATLAEPGAREPGAALERLAALLGDPDPDVRLLAATALGESHNARAVAPLADVLDDPEVNVVAAAADALGELGALAGVPALRRLAERDDFWLRLAAITSLGRIGGADAVPTLRACLAERPLRKAAAEALGEVGGSDALAALEPAAGEPVDDAVVSAAARILAARDDLTVPAWLRRAAARREDELVTQVRGGADEEAARLLGIAGTETAVEALLDMAALEDAGPATLAALSLAPRAALGGPLLRRLADAGAGERATLLGAVPAVATRVEAERILPHLADRDPEVRGAAAELLGRSPPEAVLDALAGASERPGTRLGAVEALGRVERGACPLLVPHLRDVAPEVRAAAAAGLARCGQPEASDAVTRALGDEEDPSVRRALLHALGRAGGSAAVPVLASYLSHDEVATRFSAARALGCTGAADAVRPLLDALLDDAPEVRGAALRSLGELGDPRGGEPVSGLLHSRDRDLRRAAADALRRMAPPEAAERLLEALDDPDWQVRLAAVRALRRLGGPRVAERLTSIASDDPDALVRDAASAPAAPAAHGAAGAGS